VTVTARRWWPELGLFALVATAYAAGAEVSWQSWGLAGTNFAADAAVSWRWFGTAVGFAFFPPAGVTVAAMLLTNRARWPVIVAAIVAAEVVVDAGHGMGMPTAAGIAVANAVEPLVGASAVRAWCGGPPDLRQRRDLARFVAGACVLGPLAGGVLGAAVGAAQGGIWWPAGVLRWWAGDGLGALVVGLPIVLWPRQRQIVRARPVEMTLVLAVVAALSVAAFWVRTPPAVLLLPALAWAAFRLEMIGAALSAVVLALAANYLTAAGHGAVAVLPLPVSTRLAVMQLYIAVLVVIAVLVGQEAAGRVAAVKQHRVEQRERTRLQTLSRLSELLATALTPEDIGEVVAAQVLHDAGAQALTLGLLSADGHTLNWVHVAGYPAPIAAAFGKELSLDQPAPAADAVHTGAPVLIRNRVDCERYPQTAVWMAAAGAASMGNWPLIAGARPTGVLELMWTRPQPLDAAQQAYASAVANMIAQALPRARRYADEHARAAVLQAAVLPTHLAEVAGLEIAVCYEPADVAHGLGGDWYDAMALPQNKTYLAVGDVIGHGLPAVEDMAQLRAAGRALAVQGLQAAQLLAELDKLTRHASQGKYATMAVAIFDPHGGLLTHGSAGHPPALLRRCGGTTVTRLDGDRGLVLGVVCDASYAQSQEVIVPGDILVMYTDGLVERRGQDLEAGMIQAQRHIAGWEADISLDAACKRLIADVAPPPRGDDVCVLAVRFR
jgi:serine phosphatase RsbU (regulator of sigma subunit)/integral membrane sensor domain MASE1